MATSTRPRTIFLGTPDFAVPVLRAVASAYEVAAVITQPDKPAGRGAKLTPPPVKVAANELHLRVFQPSTLRRIGLPDDDDSSPRDTEAQELQTFLRSAPPIDVGVTAAYGKIIPEPLLDYPVHGLINVHPSLLPRWRGAAPLQWAVFAGDPKTGVCLMGVEKGLDTGPVYAAAELPITESDNAKTLHDRLCLLGAELLSASLPGIIRGEITPQAQDEAAATYAEKWEADDQTVNWEDEAAVTVRRIRASALEPGARTSWCGTPVKIHAAHVDPGHDLHSAAPGTIVDVGKAELIVAAGGGTFVALDELQFPGKRKMAVKDLLLGRSMEKGGRFV